MAGNPGGMVRSGIRRERDTASPDDPTPRREVITRSPHRVVGAVPMHWVQDESVHHESHLEHCCIYALMLFGGLRRLVHQGSAIELPAGGRYRCDFVARFVDDSELIIEVKPKQLLDKVAARLDGVAEHYWRQRRTYAVITDGELLNACFEELGPVARHYARCEFPDERLDAILAKAKSLDGNCLVEDLLDPNDPASRPPVFHLIGRGRLRVFPDTWTGDASPVCIATHEPQGDLDVAHLFLSWVGARAWRAPVVVSSRA